MDHGAEVVVKHLEAQPVASIVIPGIRRHAVGAALHGALPDVFSHLHANAIEPAGPPFVRFLVGDGDSLDVEVGLPVPAHATVPETDTIKARSLPGGEAATMVHTGSFDDAHRALAEWKTAHGRVSAGPSWASYLDPTTTELADPLAPPTG